MPDLLVRGRTWPIRCAPEPHVPDPPLSAAAPAAPRTDEQPTGPCHRPPAPRHRAARRDGDATAVADRGASYQAVDAVGGDVPPKGSLYRPAPRRRALSPLNPPLVALATTVLFLLGLLAYVVMSSDASAPPADDRPQLTEVAPIGMNGD